MTLTYTIGGVTITGSAHFVDTDSVTLTDAIGQRNTITFRVVSPDGSYKPAIGAAVTVTDDSAVVRFGGNVRQLSTTQKGASLVSEIGCASWESLFDRRPTGVRSYTNQTAGDIFSDLFTNCMGSDGLTASVVTAGPTIPSFECDFASVREAFDTLCALASDDSNTYIWDCTPTKVTRFYRSDSFHAPFDVTSRSTDVLQLGGSSRIAASWALDKYTNRLFVRMGKLTRPEETQSFTIGSDTVFTLDFPVAVVPSHVKVDGVDKTIGILDVDTGKDWYWQSGSPNITRDAGGSGGTTLDITYQGQESIVVGPFENAAEVAARSAAEGNLGYYVTVLDSDVPGTATDAETRAQAWLDKYSQIPCTVSYPTLRSDLRAGMWQDIYWPEIDVDVRTLLESVTMTQVNGTYLWTVKAISGALTGDYKMRLRELKGAGGSASGSPGAPGAPGTPGAPGAGDTPPLLPTAVSASDHPADRVADFQRVVSTPVHVSVTLPSSHGADWLHLWFEDGFTGEVIDYGQFEIADPIIIWRKPGDVDHTGNVVYATTGKTGAENPLSTAAASSAFSIGRIAAPAVLGSTLTIPSGAGGTWPYDATLPNGHHYWIIPAYTWDDAPRDSSAFFYRVTSEDLGVGGSSVRAEEATSGTIVSPGGTIQTASLMGEYGRAGNGANRTGDIEAVKLRLYLCSGADGSMDAWRDSTVSTLQDTVTITVASGAAIPVDLLDMGSADPSTWGPGIYSGTDGQPTTASTNRSNEADNPGFEFEDTAWAFTTGASIVTNSAAAYTGSKFAALTAPSGGRVDVTEQARHACRPGDQWFCEAYVSHEAGCTGSGHLSVLWYDGTGAIVTPFSSEAASWAGGSSGTPWTRGGSVVTVPSGVSFFAVQFTSISETPGKSWYIDNIYLTRQVPTGAGTESDGHGGVRVPVSGIDSTLLAAQAVIASKMAANSVTAANSALAASSVVDSNVVSVGINKVTYGTSVFAGDVVLSRGISKPVIVLSNTGLNLFGQADASTGVTGLTSLPNVAIQSSGLSLFSGSNTSVTVTSSAVTLWSVNGSTSSPYVAITSSSATFASGSNSSVTVTSSAVTLWSVNGNSSSPNVSISSSGILFTGSSGLTMNFSSSGALLISNGTSNSFMTATQVVTPFVNCSAAAVSGALNMSGGSGTINFSSSVLTVTASVGSFFMPASVAGFLTIQVNGTNFKIPIFNV